MRLSYLQPNWYNNLAMLTERAELHKFPLYLAICEKVAKILLRWYFNLFCICLLIDHSSVVDSYS